MYSPIPNADLLKDKCGTNWPRVDFGSASVRERFLTTPGGSTGEMVDARAGLIRVSAALVRRKESTEQDFQRVLGFVFHRQGALLT